MNKPVLATLEQCFGSDYHKLRVYTDIYDEGSRSYFVLRELEGDLGNRDYRCYLNKAPATSICTRRNMLMISQEGVLALLKKQGGKAVTGFKRYLEICVLPVIRHEIDSARMMLPESEKADKNQEEKENMEEAIRMLSGALAFQVIKNQELETRLEIVEERLLQTAAA